MIFVNYGGGGYFFFEHSVWNGNRVNLQNYIYMNVTANC